MFTPSGRGSKRIMKTEKRRWSNVIMSILAASIATISVIAPADGWSAASTARGPQLPVSNSDSNSGPAIMTFQAWKSLRLEEARLVLDRLTLENQADRTANIERSPGEKLAVIKSSTEASGRVIAPKAAKTGNRNDSRIEQAQMNLEIAQDLTVNDYLQIYLSRFRSRDSLLDVARRMGPDEVADLLVAYQKLASGAQVAEHTTSPAPRLSPRPL